MAHILRGILQVCAVLLVACGRGSAPDGSTATDAVHASVESKSENLYCDVIIERVVSGNPPVFSLRLRGVHCIDPNRFVEIGRSIGHDPVIAWAQGELGVVVAYTKKNSISGSSPITLDVVHVDPTSMAIIRRANLAVSFGAGNVHSGTPLIDEDGTTLVVWGTKNGAFPGETGNYSNYTAVYADFFTSIQAPTIYTY